MMDPVFRQSLNSYGLSDIGLSRPNNEDVWIALPDIAFFALADGMGGHQAGEVAAKEAIENLCQSARALAAASPIRCPELVIALRLAIEKANRRVYELGQESENLSGMGTTLCCLYWTQEAVIYGHVGDSRIYRYRKPKLEQLTRDHSLFARWMARNEPPVAAEAPTSCPHKNRITRAVGTGCKANPEIAVANYEPGDLFLLCSDGLSDVLSLTDIEKILERSSSLEESATHLIEKAKIKGSTDNITVLLVQHPIIDAASLPRQQLDNSSRSEGLVSHDGRP